jgi:hypothetical protein
MKLDESTLLFGFFRDRRVSSCLRGAEVYEVTPNNGRMKMQGFPPFPRAKNGIREIRSEDERQTPSTKIPKES